MVRRSRGQRAIGTVIKTHPTVAAQQHRTPHHRGGVPHRPIPGGSTWAHRLEENGRSGGRSSKFAGGQIRQNHPRIEERIYFRSHATDVTPTDSMRSSTSRLMKICGEPVSSIQRARGRSAARGRGRPRRDRQDLGAAFGRRVRKTGRKLRRRTWSSARHTSR